MNKLFTLMNICLLIVISLFLILVVISEKSDMDKMKKEMDNDYPACVAASYPTWRLGYIAAYISIIPLLIYSYNNASFNLTLLIYITFLLVLYSVYYSMNFIGFHFIDIACDYSRKRLIKNK